MFIRIFMTAIVAGVLAGLFMTAIQQVHLNRYILEAETYETAGAASHNHSGHSHSETATTHEEAWAPDDAAERALYSGVANILVAIAFGLLLCVGYAIRGQVDWRQGLLWGLAGFLSFNLAPALGLPPELPGAAAAPLLDRQVWWLFAVIATIVGLALIAFAPRIQYRVLGFVAIALPHIVGAPYPATHAGLAPPELETAFIYASLVGNAAFWLVLGALSAYLFNRVDRQSAPATA